MFGFLIAIAIGVVVGLGLSFGGVFGIGWSITCGVLAFIVAQVVIGRIIQKRVKEAMDSVQNRPRSPATRRCSCARRWSRRRCCTSSTTGCR